MPPGIDDVRIQEYLQTNAVFGFLQQSDFLRGLRAHAPQPAIQPAAVDGLLEVGMPPIQQLAASNSNRAEGSGLPHATLSFLFGNDVARFCLDDWTNVKNSTLLELLRASITSDIQARAASIVANWNLSTCFFDELLDILFLDTASAGWLQKKDVPSKVTLVQPGICNLQQRALFVFLASGSVACEFRWRTAQTLNIARVPVEKKPTSGASQTIQITLSWQNVLRAIRRQARSLIANPHLIPSTYSENGNEMDGLILDLPEPLPDFRDFMEIGLLMRGSHGTGYTIEEKGSDDRFKYSCNKMNDVKAAIRHMRFLLYVEWRCGLEIMTIIRQPSGV